MSQRFEPLTFSYFMIRTSGLSKSGSICTKPTMVLDRQESYTRPVIGLRCVCKDEHGQSGRSSPIAMRIRNLHFFAPISMAQPIAHNFRRMSMAELEPDSQSSLTMRKDGMSGMGRANTRRNFCWPHDKLYSTDDLSQCGAIPLLRLGAAWVAKHDLTF